MGLAMCEEGGLRDRAQAQQSGGRQVYESKYMGRDEIDSILRIQWRSLHNGPPYQEDYYFQVPPPLPPPPLHSPATFQRMRGVPPRAHSRLPTGSTAGPQSAVPAAVALQDSCRPAPHTCRRSAAGAQGLGTRAGASCAAPSTSVRDCVRRLWSAHC